MPLVTYVRTLNVDEPLARIEANGTVRYYQTDALGSVIALTDQTGKVKTQYTYDPFGNATITGEQTDNPFQYTGRENDGTGLYYYRARYYSSELQRFISEDPIGLKGGMNRYAYTLNNPVNDKDPLGLYGTSSCAYYDVACKKYGGIYYCTIAPAVCNVFGDLPGNSDECMRECLQDFDMKFCHDPCKNYDSYTCKVADSHAYCLISCASNPDGVPNEFK